MPFDPDKNLAEQLRLAKSIADRALAVGSRGAPARLSRNLLALEAALLAELVKGLDHYLKNGGHLPAPWYGSAGYHQPNPPCDGCGLNPCNCECPTCGKASCSGVCADPPEERDP